MKTVVLNGLQAANRSGTGEYTIQLARRLASPPDDMDIRVLWEEGLPFPGPLAHNSVLTPVRVSGAMRRIALDHTGFRRIARSMNARLIHYPANIGGLFSATPILVTIHDVAFLRDPAWFRRDRVAYYGLAIRRAAKRAVRVIASSKATAIDIETLLQIPRDRIDVIPLGVDFSFFEHQTMTPEVREKYRLPVRYILYVGTLEPRKNLIRLFQAWDATAGDHPYDLVLAGRPGWKVQPILDAARSTHHSARIHFPGFIEQSDLPMVVGGAHVFAWPSLWEGFGLPPLAAMAAGVPTLTSNTSSLPEVVGEAAATVDPLDVESIAEALGRLVHDETLRARLVEKGRERAALFPWDNTARMVLDSYRKALADL